MLKASVSSLVESSGSEWLWVHAVLIWWISITWILTVLWITWGGLAYRRREVRQLAARVKALQQAKILAARGEDGIAGGETYKWTVGNDCEGIKRFRTLLVANIPPDSTQRLLSRLSTIADTVEVRDEQTLRDYFDYYLHRHLARSNNMPIPKETPRISKEGARYAVSRPSTQQSHIGFNEVVKKRNHPKTNDEKASKSPDFTDAPARASGETQAGDSDLLWESEVHEVILVRKLGPLANLRDRRQKVLRQLEVVSVFQTLSWSH